MGAVPARRLALLLAERFLTRTDDGRTSTTPYPRFDSARAPRSVRWSRILSHDERRSVCSARAPESSDRLINQYSYLIPTLSVGCLFRTVCKRVLCYTPYIFLVYANIYIDYPKKNICFLYLFNRQTIFSDQHMNLRTHVHIYMQKSLSSMFRVIL